MSTQEIADAVMELPEDDRLELARRIIASLAPERELLLRVEQAVGGIEDIVTGKTRGLTESEFRAVLG